MNLESGGAVFIVPALDQSARAGPSLFITKHTPKLTVATGEYVLSTISAEGQVYLEATPGTKQAWLNPPTPEPTPRSNEADEEEDVVQADEPTE